MKEIHVRATVSYCVYIDQKITVDDNADEDAIEVAVMDLSDKYLMQGGVKPILNDDVEIVDD